jgi:hypothetical protein
MRRGRPKKETKPIPSSFGHSVAPTCDNYSHKSLAKRYGFV